MSAPISPPSSPTKPLLERLIDDQPSSKLFWTARSPVEWCGELDRVVAIPRRAPDYDLSEASKALAAYRRHTGCGDPACVFARHELRPIQIRALHELAQEGGLLAPIGVGGGKALISLLAPTVVGANVSVLLVPPQLVEQTKRVADHLAHHWRLPTVVGCDVAYPDSTGTLHIVPYSLLSSYKQHDILERLAPDFVIADEAHSLKSSGAARTKRFLRYFRARSTTRFAALSGTIISKSLKDAWHLSRLALRDRSPLPTSWPVLESWASALDPSETPSHPGALEKALCKPGEAPRSGFRRRIVETNGVVATSESQLATALNIYERKLKAPPEVMDTLRKLRKDWVTPWEEYLSDALTVASYGRQIAAGLMYRRIWPNNEPEHIRREWLDARKEWACEVRERIKLNLPGQDSPELCRMAAAAGRWKSQTWARWAEIKDQACPDTEAVWISDFAVRDAIEWGRKHVGIIWYEHDALGKRIAEEGGFPFYTGGEWSSANILTEKGDRTIVASIRAHGEGKNLYAFSKNLITPALPTNPKTVEQLLGRTHRPGQLADEVEVYLYRHTTEVAEAIDKALENARFAEAMNGTQKLLYATFAF